MQRERCPACSLPRIFHWFVKWDTNGTIVTRIHPTYRLVLVEAELMGDIFHRVEEAMGMPIGHLVFEAERAAAKATIDHIVPSWSFRFTRNRLVMHPVSRAFQLLARQGGLADCQTVYYHVYHGSLARAKNPFNRELLAAMVVGAFESAEGVSYDHTWVEVRDDLYLLILPARGKPEYAERLAPHLAVPRPGDRHLESCARCGLPRDLWHLRWDVPNATIKDTRRDVRMSFIEGYTFPSVFRELVSELGEEVIPIIVGASCEYTLRNLEETGFQTAGSGRRALYDGFLGMLPAYGQGNPVEMALDDHSLEAIIENPYCSHLLAGQILAIYEKVEGKKGVVQSDDHFPDYVKITVTPA